MSTGHGGADETVRAEIARAFRTLRPDMIENARKDADLDPASPVPRFSDDELEQFINAYESLFMEALEGSGRQTRELIFETALPPILDLGPTTLDMMRGNVISAVMLPYRLLPHVAPEHRDAAARWLAGYHGEYAHDLLERLLALQADRG